MIPRECRRLAEVDFPIAEVSEHAARERRRGHPAKLHLWWARRPLASCRAMLMALLLPDPCDPYCPQVFKKDAREILLRMYPRPRWWATDIESDEGLRRIILRFIADFANWDNAANREYLKTGRGLICAAHPDEQPVIIDPFAGGGSIPLEALRLGTDSFGSDLNPIPVLLNKIVVEYVPRYGQQLIGAVERWATWIDNEAKKRLADFYPDDPDGATPIAYLWARTIQCEAPKCGAIIPLMNQTTISKRRGVGARLSVQSNSIAIEIQKGKPSSFGPGTVTDGRIKLKFPRHFGRKRTPTS